jgi:hypothetical protein
MLANTVYEAVKDADDQDPLFELVRNATLTANRFNFRRKQPAN